MLRSLLSKLLLIQLIGLGFENLVEGTSVSCRGPTTQAGRLTGVNLAGLEFGMNPDGSLTNPIAEIPLKQIDHFITQNVNIFRIPFAWQRLQSKTMGPLDTGALGVLKNYVKYITASKASVIIDLHNYGRRDGKIVGEASDLPASTLANFWSQMAKEFKDNPNVIFGVMNEPHDIKQDVWIQTLQTVVTAIRNGGAKNKIILSATNWSHLSTFADAYNAGMSGIKNPDGGSTDLVFDIHQYFDSDGSGTGTVCQTSHVEELKAVVDLLKKNNRQAMITEFGSSNDPSCTSMMSQFIAAVNDSFPQILGYTIWAAGAFPQSYPLVITVLQNNQWVDQQNFKAIQKYFTPSSSYH